MSGTQPDLSAYQIGGGRATGALGGLGLILLSVASVGWTLLYAKMLYDFIFRYGPFQFVNYNRLIVLSILLPFLGTALYFGASLLMGYMGYRILSLKSLGRAPYFIAWLLSGEAVSLGSSSLGADLTFRPVALLAGVLAMIALVLYRRRTLHSTLNAGLLGASSLLLYSSSYPYAPPVASQTLAIILTTTEPAQYVARFSLNLTGLSQWLSWGFGFILLSLVIGVVSGAISGTNRSSAHKHGRSLMALLCSVTLLFGLGFVIVGFETAYSLDLLLTGISAVTPLLVSGLETMKTEILYGVLIYSVAGMSGLLVVVASLSGLLGLYFPRKSATY